MCRSLLRLKMVDGRCMVCRECEDHRNRRGGERKMDWDPPSTPHPHSFDLLRLLLLLLIIIILGEIHGKSSWLTFLMGGFPRTRGL